MNPKHQQVIEAFSDGERLARQGGVVVEQMMTAAPTCVRPETSAPEIVKLLYTESFHHLLVTDADDTLVGVISDRDVVRCFCRGANGNISGMAGTTATDIMSTNLATIMPDTSLREAVGLMRDRGISCLPVLVEAKLVGILTDSDLWALLHTVLDVMEETSLRDSVVTAVSNMPAASA